MITDLRVRSSRGVASDIIAPDRRSHHSCVSRTLLGSAPNYTVSESRRTHMHLGRKQENRYENKCHRASGVVSEARIPEPRFRTQPPHGRSSRRAPSREPPPQTVVCHRATGSAMGSSLPSCAVSGWGEGGTRSLRPLHRDRPKPPHPHHALLLRRSTGIASTVETGSGIGNRIVLASRRGGLRSPLARLVEHIVIR